MFQQKLLRIIVLFFILLAVPLTVFIAQKQQEIRQKAQERQKVSVYLANTGGVKVNEDITFSGTESKSLELYIDASSRRINTFNVTISWPQGGIEPISLTEENGAAQFKDPITELDLDRSKNSKTIHFEKVADTPITGLLKILTVEFRTQSNSQTRGVITLETRIHGTELNMEDNQTPSLTYVIRGAGQENPSTTPNPTGLTSPTPTGNNAGTEKHTRFDITLALQAIGELTQGNKDPKHKQRQVRIELFNKNSTKPIITKVGTINYESATGLFRALVDMGDIKEGDYTIKMKPIRPIGYLRKIVPPGVIHIVPGTTNKIPTGKVLVFIVGDLNLDNALDIQDYNIYISCFGEKLKDKKSCKDKEAVDLNDDGKTDSSKDLTDYKWLFNSFQNQYGD